VIPDGLQDWLEEARGGYLIGKYAHRGRPIPLLTAWAIHSPAVRAAELSPAEGPCSAVGQSQPL